MTHRALHNLAESGLVLNFPSSAYISPPQPDKTKNGNKIKNSLSDSEFNPSKSRIKVDTNTCWGRCYSQLKEAFPIAASGCLPLYPSISDSHALIKGGKEDSTDR